ncbi:hypothetical protein [Neobacillus jeddahensis]|nr:hypothetical protein [Neobacillus jeddahensis]
MKKLAIILFSVTVLSLITSTTTVNNQKSSVNTEVASKSLSDYPIHPPVG